MCLTSFLLTVQEPHFKIHCPSENWGKGKGLPCNDNPLQYSCLENLMDGEAW